MSEDCDRASDDSHLQEQNLCLQRSNDKNNEMVSPLLLPSRRARIKYISINSLWKNDGRLNPTICKTMPNLSKVEEEEEEIQKVTTQELESISWDNVCIDSVGHYTATDQKDNDRILNVITFVDPAVVY